MAIPGLWPYQECGVGYPIKSIRSSFKKINFNQLINYYIKMVRRRSLKTLKRDKLILKAIARVKSGLYKSANDALQLRPDIT
jgi:hypothetical protein